MLDHYFGQMGRELVQMKRVSPFSERVKQADNDQRLETLALKVIRNPPIAVDISLDTQRFGFLQVDDLGAVAPLDDQFGVHPLRAVPDALHHALLEPLERPTSLYGVVDAALIDALEERLIGEGLRHMSLFSGEARREHGAAGPWLVSLDETSPLLRQLMTALGEQDNDWAFWQRQAAVFIRTGMSFDHLAAHLKRFTRVQDEDGRWMMFRFYNPSVLSAYLKGIEDWPERLRRWFYPNEGDRIEAIVTTSSTQASTMYRPGPMLTDEGPRLAFSMTQRDRRPLRDLSAKRTIAAMAADLKRLFGKELVDRSDAEIEVSVHRTVARLRTYGITHAGQLLHFSAWDIFYGHGFETRDATGGLSKILQSAKTPEEKFSEFSETLTSMYRARY